MNLTKMSLLRPILGFRPSPFRLSMRLPAQIRFKHGSLISQHTYHNNRPSAGDSKSTPPNALEKNAQLDIQSTYAHQGLKEHQDSLRERDSGVPRAKKPNYKEEFPEAPEGVIGMEDERGDLERGRGVKHEKCEHEGVRGTSKAKDNSHFEGL